MTKTATFVAGIIFLVVSIFHLVRLFFPIEFNVAGWNVPEWMSGVVFVVAGTLSAFMFRLSRD